jgi:nucleotide-binding universal stress UspA family protein
LLSSFRGSSIVYKAILVPTDGSDLSAVAIREAATLAKELSSRLVLFYAAPMSGLSAPTRRRERELAQRTMEQEANAVFDAAKDKVDLAGVNLELRCMSSNSPYEAIIEASKEFHCDLVIMASHVRQGLSKVLRGSETEAVLANSKIPVIVVH